jgi:hypothetical protein
LQPLEAYVDRSHEIRGSKRGTPELSYRAALENLLNAIGADLEPCTRRRNWPTSAPAGPIFGSWRSSPATGRVARSRALPIESIFGARMP